MSVFSLSARVAVVGSRHGSPFPVARFARAVVAAGGSVVSGCASGVDAAALSAVSGVVSVAAGSALPASGSVRLVAASRQPAALGQRTSCVVAAACAVAVFPPASGEFGPGSLLALRLALRAGLPVFAAGRAAPPLGSGWVAATVAGVSGWLRPSPAAAQASLF